MSGSSESGGQDVVNGRCAGRRGSGGWGSGEGANEVLARPVAPTLSSRVGSLSGADWVRSLSTW
jgi:hypothetical protein